MNQFRISAKVVLLSSLLLGSFFVAFALVCPGRINSPFSVFPLNPSFAASADSSTVLHPLSKASKGNLPISDLSEEEAILHALNRLGYGPRPGDIERVRKMGLQHWIELQLHPARIDDSALAARLQDYPSLRMSTAKLVEEYPTPEMAAKRLHIPVDEYRKQLAELAKLPPGQRGAADQQPQRIVEELQMAKLVRAIYSERQFEERLLDFWFNHFNVFIYKDNERYLLTSYEREVLRPRVLGKFGGLLMATAESPAMLRYLDNWLSADSRAFERQKHMPHPRPRYRLAKPSIPLGGKRGLNENYGRELLELHTLGVDGGYTQQDVIAVARCFTGWTLRAANEDAEFYFDDRIHDPDKKKVLGKKIHAGGIRDGQEVLKFLVHHPSTARFISSKLARQFVSDAPPPGLVGRMVKTFQKTEGDIRAVLQAMIYSPEFWSRDAYRAKVKRPFDLVVSTARALGTDVDTPMPLVNWVSRIGEPLYACQPPTGYSDHAEAWVNTGALLNRLNFAVALAGNHVRGARVDLASLVGNEVTRNPQHALDRAVEEFLGGQVSPQTRTTLEQQSSNPRVLRATLDDPVKQVDLGILAGLVLGSPEFQRR